MRTVCRAACSMIAILTLVGVRSADACSCMASGPACQAYWNTDAVFDATVVRIATRNEPRTIASLESIETARLVTLEVHRAWKGASAGTLEVFTAGSGAACGYDFKQGQRYLVFAYARGGRLVVSSCSGTQPFDGTGPAAAFLASLEAPPRGGRIFGTVRTHERVFDYGTPNIERDTQTTVHLSGGGGTRTTSSVSGKYEFDRLPAGAYRVEIDAPKGYATYSADRTIEIPDARACAEENFGFAPDSHVAGRLTGSDGRPLRRVMVELTRAEARPHPDYGLSREMASTDEDGFFDLKGLPPGRYIVGVNLGGVPTEYNPYARTVYPGPPNDPYIIELALGQTVDLGTWQLPPPVPIARVEGVVIDRNGAAMGGVYVHAWDATDGSIERGRGVTGATSAADGRFVLELRQGRVYSFSARAKDVMLEIRAPRLETGAQSRASVQIMVLGVRKKVPQRMQMDTHDEWLTVRTTVWGHQADLLRSVLEGSDIEVFIPDEHIGSLRSHVLLGDSGVRVQVRAADLERAKELLDSFEQDR